MRRIIEAIEEAAASGLVRMRAESVLEEISMPYMNRDRLNYIRTNKLVKMGYSRKVAWKIVHGNHIGNSI